VGGPGLLLLGQALAFDGVVRSTGSLDVLVRATPANARTVLPALADLGFGSLRWREARCSPSRVRGASAVVPEANQNR
jgi:hypothetical protein